MAEVGASAGGSERGGAVAGALPWVAVMVGGLHVEGAAAGDPSEPVAVSGERIEVRVGGLEAGERFELLVGGETLALAADARGEARWIGDGWLRAAAGRLVVGLARGGEAPCVVARVSVQATKLGHERLMALLGDLDGVAASLGADLSGRTRVERRAEEASPGALLDALEGAVGRLEDAAPRIRRRPLGRRRERVQAIAAEDRATARDVAWLVSHPAGPARLRAAGARSVAVRREVSLDLDVVENHGVLWLLQHCEGRIDELVRLLDDEREALRSTFEGLDPGMRELREADEGRRHRRLREHSDRARGLLASLADVRRRVGLPMQLRAAPPRRTARASAHPGYWQVTRATEELTALELQPPPQEWLPLGSVDELYETWVVVALARALCELTGESLDAKLRVERAGRWFASLPRGEVVRLRLDDSRELVLHREPSFAHRGSETVVKLHRGRPWCPDAVVEVRHSGQPIGLHVFDAKHRVGYGEPGGVPWSSLHEVWFKYGESIGYAETRLPAVSSLWIVYPGERPGVRLMGPRMLSPTWPVERLRGGAIAASPGAEAGVGIREVVAGLFGDWCAAIAQTQPRRT